jgi:hypothetical protein
MTAEERVREFLKVHSEIKIPPRESPESAFHDAATACERAVDAGRAWPAESDEEWAKIVAIVDARLRRADEIRHKLDVKRALELKNLEHAWAKPEREASYFAAKRQLDEAQDSRGSKNEMAWRGILVPDLSPKHALWKHSCDAWANLRAAVPFELRRDADQAGSKARQLSSEIEPARNRLGMSRWGAEHEQDAADRIRLVEQAQTDAAILARLEKELAAAEERQSLLEFVVFRYTETLLQGWEPDLAELHRKAAELSAKLRAQIIAAGPMRPSSYVPELPLEPVSLPTVGGAS